MMKQKILMITLSIFLVAICVAWTVRYISLNQYFQNTYSLDIQYLPMHEYISFDENILNGYSLNGYEIRVDSAQIMSYEDFLTENDTQNTSIDTSNAPEKVCVVTVTLKNNESEVDGVYLPDFVLHGIDNFTDYNASLIDLANPVLDGALGISLAPNTEYTVNIVYNLRSMHFSESVWNDIEDYQFWLQITDYPIRMEIRLDME